jgi:hypothetical protein
MSQFDMNNVFQAVADKFKTYKQLLHGTAQGRIRHLFVHGSPGLGKSFEAEQILGAYSLGKKIRYHRSAGYTTPLSLYNSLYEWRRRGDVLLYDDCDTAFQYPQCMNILKAATDTKERRVLSWGTTSKAVRCREFLYEGQLVVITNVDFEKDRFSALTDRVTSYNLTLSPEEVVARVIDVIHREPKYPAYHDEVIDWLIDNHMVLGTKLTIRTAVKALELAAYNLDTWKELAAATILGGL